MEVINSMNKKRFGWIMRVFLSAMMTTLCALGLVDYSGMSRNIVTIKSEPFSLLVGLGKAMRERGAIEGVAQGKTNALLLQVLELSSIAGGARGEYGHGVLKLGCRV